MRLSISKKRLFIGVIIVMGFVFFNHHHVLRMLGSYLVYETPFEEADVALVLTGGNGKRVKKGVELYHSGKVDLLIMNGGGGYMTQPFATRMKEYALSLGIPEEDILMEIKSLSTFESAKFVLPMLQQLQVRKGVLVTSKYHTRRSYKIYEKIFRDSGISLYVVGAPDQINYQSWWKNHEMAEDILIEWAKTIVYWMKYWLSLMGLLRTI
ncbi:MAG: YdcF family protein [Candidatus Margulisbacteria bacterium]|nr:YdcF family protein [Candidatus Margulisiibacteriota bacterium]